MPVKVRCKSCGHAVNAPDKARGKAIRCPKCKKPVKVPAGEKSGDDINSDSSAFLKQLNVDRIEDTSVDVCPSCGAEIPEDEEECYECGFDLTQQTVSRSRDAAPKGPKGPNTAGFYERAWGDSFGFATSHIGVAIFTTILTLVCTPIAFFSWLWVYTWPQIPLKLFFGLIGTVAFLIPIGWVANLHLLTIQKTLKKKGKLGKVRFDFALAAAQGLKMIAWFLVFGLPFIIIFGGIGFILAEQGIAFAYAGAAGLVVLCVLPMVPAAMAHLAMPVQYRAWLMPTVGPIFIGTIGPSLMILVMGLVLNLIPIAGIVGAVVWKQNDLETFQIKAENNARLYKTILDAEWGGEETSETLDQQEKYNWDAWMFPGIAVGVASLFVGFNTLVVARANGLYTFFCKSGLNLITAIPEVQYVKKGGKDQKVLSLKRSYPAGHGKRFLAAFLDGLILNAIGATIGGLAYFIISMVGEDNMIVFWSVIGVADVIHLGIVINYFVSGHSGIQQATSGKNSMDLFVCDVNGEPITGMTAFLRFWVKNLSIIFTGGLIAIVPLTNPEHRAVHDMVCGTQVREIKPIRKKKVRDDDE